MHGEGVSKKSREGMYMIPRAEHICQKGRRWVRYEEEDQILYEWRGRQRKREEESVCKKSVYKESVCKESVCT